MKNIVILGSTGSIGKSTLNVVSRYPDKFNVIGLTAGRNISILKEQIEKFKPDVVAVSDENAYRELVSSLPNARVQILIGTEGICDVARMPGVDIVISAIMGAAGLLPTISAINTGRIIGIANKETLVMAGDIVMSEAKKYSATLLPVDSEHSAIFQCIQGYKKSDVKKIILTASGGPFVGKTTEELMHVSPEDALKHPNWSMGRKITIDSATLMNKGLEVIEAHYLFDMPPDKIEVLIHPQSIVHSIVEFNDNTYLAQLSRPDMQGPIAYALSFPERLHDVVPPLDWELFSRASCGLTFQKPDNVTFPCLSMAYFALKTGGTMPAVLNASNEIAVSAFLNGIVSFNSIPVIIKNVMDFHRLQPAKDIEVVLEADRWAREKTLREIKLLSN